MKCTDKWEQKSIHISNYGKGVRFIVWEDSGKSAEYWAGHYGTKIDAPSLMIALKPNSAMKFSRFIAPRPVPNKLPFATSFNTGCGPNLFMNGKKVKDEPWNNLLAQDAVVTFDDVIENKTQFRLTDKVAFDGSNAIEVDLSVPKELEIPTDLQTSSMTLFRTEFDLTAVDELEISYFMKKSHSNSTADIALLINMSTGVTLVLTSDTFDAATSRPNTTLMKPTKTISHGEWQQRMFVLAKLSATITSVRLVAYHHHFQLIGWPYQGPRPKFQQNQKIYLGLLLMRDHIEKIPYDTEEVHIDTNWHPDSIYEGKIQYI